MTGRRGYTLVELLVALTLLAVLLAGLTGVLARQWRMYASLDARHAARVQLRAGADAMRASLRPLSARADSLVASDVVALTDTLIDVRSTLGASVVCGMPDARTVDLPPLSLDPPTLSWWTSPPQSGDLMLVHDAPTDSWSSATIESVGSSVGACGASPLLRPSDAGRARLRVRITAPLAAGAAVGSPVRLLRRVRWQHYRASDGRWYLGQREWDGSAWSGVQPVAGPLRGPGSPAGLSVGGRDSAGAASGGPAGGPLDAASLARVREIGIVLRADAPAAGDRRGAPRIDSVDVRVAVERTP